MWPSNVKSPSRKSRMYLFIQIVKEEHKTWNIYCFQCKSQKGMEMTYKNKHHILEKSNRYTLLFLHVSMGRSTIHVHTAQTIILHQIEWLELWCLMQFSTILQLYSGRQFYWWKRGTHYPEKTTDLPPPPFFKDWDVQYHPWWKLDNSVDYKIRE